MAEANFTSPMNFTLCPQRLFAQRLNPQEMEDTVQESRPIRKLYSAPKALIFAPSTKPFYVLFYTQIELLFCITLYPKGSLSFTLLRPFPKV